MKCPDCGFENIAGEEACEACSASLYDLALPEGKAKTSTQRKVLAGTLAQLKPHEAVSLPEEASVADAVAQMRRLKMGCVLVTADGRLSGIFTERDLLLKVAGRKDPAEVRLREVMKPDPQCLKEDDSVALAFHHMAVKEHRHIPVLMKDGRLGIVSSRDLLRYLCS